MSYEGLVRARGFVPSVTDDIPLWSLTRSGVGRNDPGEIVLIGASRIQTDINGEVFAEVFGEPKPKQLAIAANNPLPILDHFARDETFQGLILCDVMPIYFFTGVDTTASYGAEYVAYAQKDRSWDLAATQLRVFLESRLALRAPDVAPSPAILLGLLGLGVLPRQYAVVDACRYVHQNRRPEEVPREYIEQLAAMTERAQPASAERLDRDLATLNDAVLRIQARGGQVVFIVLPVSGLRREAEERRFPRSEFWDKFAARIDAVTIHFDDYPELSGFLGFDGSHLNAPDAAAFTRSFASILKTKLRRGAPSLVGPPRPSPACLPIRASHMTGAWGWDRSTTWSRFRSTRRQRAWWPDGVRRDRRVRRHRSARCKMRGVVPDPRGIESDLRQSGRTASVDPTDARLRNARRSCRGRLQER
jgi:hypothetical protein